MKHLIPLLLCAALLCGCEATFQGDPLAPSSEVTEATVPQGMYVPGSAMETATSGAVQAFSLPMADVQGIRMSGEDVLVFSGIDQTTITRLTGAELYVVSSVTLDGLLSPDDPSLTIGQKELSYYEADSRQIVVLDAALREISRYPLPDTLMGTPILSEDRTVLYYCTPSAVMAWDLQKDLHRTLKMMAYSQQSLQGLYLDDTVLLCRIEKGNQVESLFLSTEDGRLLYQQNTPVEFSDHAGFYFCKLPAGENQTLVFGTAQSQPFALIPEDLSAACTFLPQCLGAVTVGTADSGQAFLQYYNLSTGALTAAMTLPEAPIAITSSTQTAPFLLVSDPELGNALYRWNCSGEPEKPTLYTAVHRTPDNPDWEGLAKCRTYASQLSEKYGISIRVWKDATAVEPWDYDLETEYQVPLIWEELEALDQRLSHFPKSLLEDTASHFSSLSICLVRQITGTDPSTSLDTAIGLQFVEGTDAFLALSAGLYSEHALYHEFFHLMESHILGTSNAFDRWEELNPTGFVYGNTVSTNVDSSEYLDVADRAFVDTYSMRLPKEDRARIWEYAMLPGNQELFRFPTLQRKLQTLCDGIRDAYNLKDTNECFLWEQYLN